MAEMVERSGLASPASPRRASLRPSRGDVAGLAVVVALLTWAWVRFGALFPQAEFVDWITFPAGRLLRSSVEALLTFSNDGFSRHVAIVWAAALGRACGSSLSCINAFAFAPYAGGAFALYALARVMRLPAAAAAAVVGVVIVSWPSFDVLRWQATLLDRFALLFTSLALIAITLAVRHARPGWGTVAWRALALTVLVEVTLDTKEPAWIVLPLLALAPWLLAADRRRMRWAAATLALPLAVGTVHVIATLRGLDAQPAANAHVSDGAISVNLPALTRYALPGGQTALIALTLLGLLCVALAVRARHREPQAVQVARYAVWIAAGVAVGWAIPARTMYPSVFYMLVPLATLALAVALALRAAQLALGASRLRLAAPVAGTALAAWCIGVSALDRWDAFGDFLAMNAKFRASLPELVELRERHADKRVMIHAPTQPLLGYLVGANPAQHFWRLAGAEQPSDRWYPIGLIEHACADAATVVVTYDDRIRPVGTCPK